MSAEDTCWHTWTTGTGPGDPNDTGVHSCEEPPGHNHPGSETAHRCRCGAQSPAEAPVDDAGNNCTCSHAGPWSGEPHRHMGAIRE